MKESHGYRFVIEVSNPYEVYETLKPFLVKEPKNSDPGLNSVFKTDYATLVISLVRGKMTIHTDLNKRELKQKLKELLPQYYSELVNNLRLNKKELRRYNSIRTKSGYTDYHIYEDYIHSPSPNLQKKIDGFDVSILSYVIRENSIGTNLYKIFHVGYHWMKRRLDKLAKLRLLEKLGKSPAIYTMTKDDKREHLIREFVAIWYELFHSTPHIHRSN